MYDHDIDTFITVAQTSSFSAASRKLYISTSAVVQQINLLEEKLNCTLFDRNSHGVTLTEAGKLFLSQSQRIKRICLEAEQLMKAYQQTITVGTGYLSTTTLLDKYWPQFTATNNATLKFQEIKDYEKIPASVDLIECIYSQEPIPKQGFLFKKITTTPLQIAVPPENPLATKDKLTITDLNNQKVLILKSNILGQSKEVSTFLKIHCPNIHLASYSVYNKAVVNEALLKNDLILVHQSLVSSCTPLIAKKIDWHFNADVGFFYRNNANNITKKLISAM